MAFTNIMRNKILILIFFSFLIIGPVFASDEIDQQQMSSAITTATYTGTYSQTFIPDYDNFKKFYFGASCSVGNYGALVISWELIDDGDITLASGIINSACNSNSNIYFTATTTAVRINAGQTYKMEWTNSGPGQVKYIYAGGGYGDGYATGPGIAGTTYDFFFIEYYDTAYQALSVLWDAEIIVPGPNYVYSGSTQTIVYKYSNYGGLYDEIWFKIYKLSGKNGTPVMSMVSPHMEIASTTVKTIDGMVLDYDPGFYQLYNSYYAGNSGNNFIDSPINFEVLASTTMANASTSLSEMLTQVEETICDDIDTSTTWGQILCALKRSALFVFKPDDASINTFIASYIELKQSFPFNAFFGITDALQSGVSTTTASTTSTLMIPFIDDDGDFNSISVVGSTTLSNLIGVENNNIFRNSIVYFAWIVAGFIIYFTVRRI